MPELSPAAEAALLAYAWPGNVRELRNAIERAVILWPAERLEPRGLPRAHRRPVASAAARLGGDFTLEEIEREHILRVLGRDADAGGGGRRSSGSTRRRCGGSGKRYE